MAVLRSVAKTDTFEIFRQKVNQIASDVFSIQSGGSDLSTGNLKLGDGTRTAPALAFLSDASLGIYKPSAKTFGFVSNNKKIVEYSDSQVYNFRDLILQKNVISTNDVTVSNYGTNYDPGNYSNIALLGGTGSGATASIEVTEYVGSITNAGKNYSEGTYTNIPLTGGSGTGAIASFSVEGIEGTITNSGSGYISNTYSNIPLSGGSGTGATANITITGDTTFGGSITSAGSGYTENVYNSVQFVNTPTQTFTVASITNPGTPPPASVYTINGTTQDSLTLIRGNTYRFNVSSNTLITAPLIFRTLDDLTLPPEDYAIVQKGSIGTAGAFIDLIIKPTAALQNIKYDSSSSPGSGGTITITSGTVGSYGSNGSATVTVGASGTVTNFQISFSGSDYKQNDILQIYSGDVGGAGSGFQYTLGAPTYNGVISSVDIVNNGINYLKNDILSVNSSNLGNQGSGFLYTITSDPGIVKNLQFSQKGKNYQINNILNLPSSISGISATLDSASTTVQLTSVSGIISGSTVTKTSGTGVLANNTTVLSVSTTTNSIVLSQAPSTSGSVVLTFVPPYGTPTANFQYQISNIGEISNFSISSGGNGYSINDVLSVNEIDLTQPIELLVINRSLQTITFVETVPTSSFSVGDTIVLSGSVGAQPATIYEIISSGGNIQSLLVDFSSYTNGDAITNDNISPTTYTINTASSLKYRYFIDDGSGYKLTPSFTLYSGNTYDFNLSDSSNSNHLFALSTFRDGIWGPSLIQNISTTLSSSSPQITVSDTTGILPGMSVSSQSGSGQLGIGTKVLSVPNSTTIILDVTPVTSGNSVLTFRGTEYTDGVERTQNRLRIKVTDTTPNLYYYCGIQNSMHADEGGEDNSEALLTVNLNNPKTFGSGFSVTVDDITTENIITANVQTGDLSAVSFTGDDLTVQNASISDTLIADSINGNSISTNSVSSDQILTLTGSSVNVSSNFTVGSTVQVNSSTGNITTNGILRTNSTLNVNNVLTINNSTISSSSGNNLILSPASNSLAVVNSSTAFVIPSGSSLQRPSNTIAINGAIRFNTDSGQYEGYSESTSTWSSLGGIRDLDGNTYIAAEAFTGANDNVLYFYNDDNNTLKLTTNYLDFNTVKRLRSLDINLPAYVEWTSNFPVTLGQFVKYRNNLYEVTQAGTTGTSGAEPIHTTGAQANGTSVLTWYSSAVAPLTFEEIQELRIGPNGNLPLVINGDLRLANNVLSTDVNDLIISPNSGKKVTIDAMTSLVIPSGDSNTRGLAARGSIRYNTTITQFEGYNGTNWTSLGGVKDVDGNTYIIPESVPGANENILYFYNDGENTLRLSKTDLRFNTISTISSNTNSLAINANLITLSNVSTSIDNTGSSTFISSTKDNLDFGLSVGLTNNYLLRMTTLGELIVNKGFGTGVVTPVTVLSNELKDFELDDTKLSSVDIELVKGLVNGGATNLYSPLFASGAKVLVCADNITTNTTEIIEFTVTDKNGDIFNTEYGNVNTGNKLINSSFDFNAQGDVRINFTLDDLVSTGNQVNITVVKTIIKK